MLGVEPKIYTSDDHHIRHDLIDKSALHVLKGLQEAGHTAYLVGGGVRDLLMRKRPKDFDISTSAKPEEVKAIFRNCILIGRRFRLAHIRFGRHIIEVATFRAGDPSDDELIVRDNIWGSPEEDVLRRDFTINGLCYDPSDHRIIDYVGGFEDLQAHTLRSIGDPILRFKQDPVRMIRMLKFRARFGFHMQEEDLEALNNCREEILKSSPARLLEEILRMLESGAAEPFFRLMLAHGLLDLLFPKLSAYFRDSHAEEIFAMLNGVDSMNKQQGYKTLDRSILAAALLFPILDMRVQEQNPPPNMGEIMDLSHTLVHELLYEAYSHFPRRIRQDCQFILQMQYRLTPLEKQRRFRTKIVRQKGFRLPLIFLKLRALNHHALFKTYEHWKQLSKQANP